MYNNSTIDQDEIKKFNSIANEWWNPNGKFKQLHLMNPVRISFIKQKILTHYKLIDNVSKPFNDLKVADIGCGGGITSIPMAKLGAAVTAIDASNENIKIAQIHASKIGVQVNYICTSIEDYIKISNEKYDVVLCLEVIEHISNIQEFFLCLSKILKPKGMVIISTINQTFKSYIFAIGLAEYLLRYLPKGTHNFNKFLKPSTINNFLISNNMFLKEIQGLSYNPILQQWYLSNDISINYIMYITAV
ncbi:3-demethylubiquinone-9 3-O-methyltransferase [Orientia chuto str. Dubai]|uniref:Ubiquinone biosynthesis O-methyltransferase n=1 Tax=Orientia chuto str. Dubai TaxID=1359168 RepID=A0A0F3MNR4_9RICK|nr:bifunctional 2-polyprenyl-6-hydroxyphenol methylase/3-demethylubiquinol 3-O-methyltransferase UbiG [Candidatus Orientia mediorientalis]KJV57082.1 3-demethylubiquinone-9 3-O-methyltransferase [Orientia chuto str. Dubai]